MGIDRQVIEEYKNDYEFHRWFAKDSSKETYDQIVQSIKYHLPKDWSSCLEVGCGAGTFTKVISEKNLYADYFLTDISQEMIKQAKNNVHLVKAKFQVVDTEKLRFLKKFDLILAIRTLRYCQDKFVALRRLYRALKPGGKILIVNQNTRTAFQILGINKSKEDIHQNDWSYEQYTDALWLAGFVNIKAYPCVLKAKVFGKKTDQFIHKSMHKEPLSMTSELLSGSWIITAEKS